MSTSKSMLRVLLCIFAIGIPFLRGGASPVFQPQCRSGVCDDRPECPRTTCRCVYPSKVDCSVYYQCVQGKPYQYQCSPGLLFNAETLTCDYDYKVNCSYGTSTESISSTAITEVTQTNEQTTEYTFPPSTETEDSSTLNPTSTQSTTSTKTTSIEDISTTKVYSTTQGDIIITPDTSNTSDLTTDGEITSSGVTETPKVVTTIAPSQKTDETSITDNDRTYTTSNEVIYTKPTDDLTDSDIIYTGETPKEVSTIAARTDETSITNDERTSTKDNEIIYTKSSTDPDITSTESERTKDDLSTTRRTIKPILTTTNEISTDTPAATSEIITSDSISSTTLRPTTDDSLSTTHRPTTDDSVSSTTIRPTSDDSTSSITLRPTTDNSYFTTTEKHSTENSTTDITQSELPVFECPSRFGLYPDSSNCSGFYHCSQWIPYHKQCPSGLHFNPTLTVCDWPQDAGCGELLSTTVAEENPTSPNPQSTNDTHCACVSCELPIPEDCSSYILCTETTATVITCGHGLYFNVMTSTCDFQDNVLCDPNVKCPGPSGRFPYPHSCTHFMDCEDSIVSVNQCPEGMTYDEYGGNCSWSTVCEGSTFTEGTDFTTEQQPRTGITVTSKDHSTIITSVISTEVTYSESELPSSTKTTIVLPNTSTETEKSSTIEKDIITSVTNTVDDNNNGTASTDIDNEIYSTTEVPHTTNSFTITTKSSNTVPEDRTTVEMSSTNEDIIITSATNTADDNDSGSVSTGKSDKTHSTTELPHTTNSFTITTKSSNTVPEDRTTVEMSSTNEDIIITSATNTADDNDNGSVSTGKSDKTHSTTELPHTTNSFTITTKSSTTVPEDKTSTAIKIESTTNSQPDKDTTAKIPTTPSVTGDDDVTVSTPVTNESRTTRDELLLSTTKRPLTSSPEISELTSQYSTIGITTLDPEILTDETTASENPISTETTPSATDGLENAFNCPSRFGLYPDPKNCSQFYDCSHWEANHKLCPSNLHFNPVLTVCDWPYRAGCGASSTTVAEQTTTPSDLHPTNDTYCDCDSCDLPIPDDCSSYIMCIDKAATRITCSSGLLFNAITGTCDFKDNVKCEPNVLCPNSSGRFPYPHSCAHFMECVNSAINVKKCPEEMTFDKYNRNCSWSNFCEDSETSLGSTSSAVPTTSTMNNKITTTYDELITTEINSDAPSSSTESLPPSTETSSSNETLTETTPSGELKSTTEKSVATISPETPKPISTASNNQDTETTMKATTPLPDAPETTTPTISARTVSETETSGISTMASTTDIGPLPVTSTSHDSESPETSELITDRPSTGTTSTGGTMNSTTLSSTSVSMDIYSSTLDKSTVTETITSRDSDLTTNTSPPTFTEKISTTIANITSTKLPTTKGTVVTDLTIIPPRNVSTTTTGDNVMKTSIATSSETVMPTSEQTSTNDITSTTIPSTKLSTERVSSTPSANTSHATTSSLRTTASESKTSTTSQNTTPLRNGTSENPPTYICPSRVGLFPDPENCFRFYHCSHWIPHHKWCPSELHFNAVLQVCDWPYRAGCADKSIPPTKPDEDSSTPLVNETCDCECCFTPDKKDCSRYLLCLNGKLHEGHCADGLLFNPQNSNCDLAERVNCSEALPTCPSPNGIVVNPKDCSSFYKCTNGNPVLQKCPDSKHFSDSRKECVEPCEAECDQTIDCRYKTSTAASKLDICIEDEGLYRNEKDCSSFYQCAEGQAYIVKCPYGLHFNVEYGVCEDPCDAKCDPNVVCKPRYLHASKRAVSTHCPTPNGLFPVLQDCSSFYMCSEGKGHLNHCPPGLHYSVVSETCETPCQAGCNVTQECKLSNATATNKPSSTTSNTLLSPHCEAAEGSFSNPDDCKSFYECSSGQEHLVRCPDGLHFSIEDETCESPCIANCDTTVECPIEIPDEDGNCTCENCFLPDATDCSAYYFCENRHLTKGYCPYGTLFDKITSLCEPEGTANCEAVGDPAMCPEPFGFNPYPGDCKKFVHCVDSVAYVRECEKGLEFDPNVRACSNPNGLCGNTGTDSNCVRPTGMFPHPNNCSLFFQCENGVAYLKECPPPLSFNSIDEVCDWPNNAHCEEGQSKTRPGGKKSSYPETVCEKIPGVTCPCACRVTTYDDCNSFYHCRQDGTACKRFCPEGLYFNKRKMVCDLPGNVECRDFFFTAMKRMKLWTNNLRKGNSSRQY